MPRRKCTPLLIALSASISVSSLWCGAHEIAPLHDAPVAGLMFVPVTPCRVVDTRSGYGALGQPSLAARSSRTLPILQSPCGIPTGAQAYSLNVTVAPHESLGYLTVWPTGQPQPTVSTLNSIDGRVLANAAIVPAGNNGAIDVFVTNETDVVIDINGYFTASSVQGLAFYTLAPCRVVDSRSAAQGQFAGPTLSASSFRTFIPSQSTCGIPQWAQVFDFNVTVAPYGTLGYLTAWPDGQPQPLVSTLNSINGDVLANAAIVPAGVSGGAKMFVTNKTDLIVDANGYFGPPTGTSPLSFATVTPCRVADTRNAPGALGGPFISKGGRRSFPIPQSACGIPAGAQAYSLNITAVPHGSLGYLTTWATGQPQPLASTLNSIKGQVVANAAIVPTGTNGSIDIFASDDADVIVDVNGFFTAASSSVTQPAVTSVYPANQATGIALNSGIVLSLNTAVDPASATASTVKLMNGSSSVTGTVNVSSDGLYVVFVPGSALLPSTAYTVVANGLTTPFTHAAAAAFSSSFTTGTASDNSYPTITTSPSSYSTVPTNLRLAFQSSTRLNPASVGTSYFYDQTSYISVPVTVQIASDGFTGTVIPLAPFGAGRTYYGYVYFNDIFGHSASANFSFTLSFAADAQGPTLTSSGPANGDAAVPLNAAVVLAFDQPISSLGLTAGIQLLAAGQPVPVRIALNSTGTRVTVSPLTLLTSNTNYSLLATSQIVDIAGNALLNPGSIAFQTGTAIDLLAPAVTAVTPSGSVPLNAKLRAFFNKKANPASLDSGTMTLQESSSYRGIPGTVSLSGDGLTATFTPNSPLTAGVSYYFTINGPVDMSATPFPQASTYFTTTGVTDTTPPSVLWSSPATGATGIPVNAVPNVLMSEVLDPTTVSTASVTLAAGSSAVTLSLNNATGSEITIKPSVALAPSTTYTLTLNGLKDLAGNALPLFTSTFTTSAANTADTTVPTLTSTDPLNQATGVPVNKVVTITFSEPINPVSASKVSFLTTNNVTIPGTYAVSGAVLTFTPSGAWPGNSTISTHFSVADYAGNVSSSYNLSFITASAVDTTPPSITSVTPADGATGLGGNLSVVLTFSKPLDPNTVGGNTFALYNGNTRLTPNINRSADSKTVTLTGYLPAPAIITVLVTHDVKDLAGNALPDFSSRFSTAARDLTSPRVVTQRPGSGATGIPASTAITLVLDKPLDPASVAGGFHVTQNGTLFPGSVAVVESGQAIRFTPSGQFQPGALVQVYLGSAATDTLGNPVQNYQGSFTIDSGLSTPFNAVRTSGYNIPTNGVLDIEFNQDLDPATVTATTISVMKTNLGGGLVPVTVSLSSPRVVRLTPAGSLTPNGSFSVLLSSALRSTKGVGLSNQNYLYFYTTAGPDNTAWGVSRVAPGAGAGNLGTNALIRVQLTNTVDPITVNDTTVRLSSYGVSIPVNFSFSSDNRTLTVTPNSLLPDLSTVTLSMNGVQDLVGRSLSASSTLTTGATVDTISPALVAFDVASGATDVPINSAISMLFTEALDSTSFTPDSCRVNDGINTSIAGSYSFSIDLRTVTFVPAAPFPVHRSIYLYCGAVQDLAGNQSYSLSVNFTTSFNSDSTSPQVIATNPDSGMNGAPINAQIQILFDEPVQATSLGSIALLAGGSPVAITPVMVAPSVVGINTVALLAPNTTYTLSIVGVRDLAGNFLAVPVITTFSTGASADLIYPTSAASPTTSSVGTNASVRLHFSERVNRVSVLSSFKLYLNQSYNQYVPAITAIAADGLSATLTPKALLAPNTSYNVSYAFADVAGNSPYTSSYAFSTGPGPDNTGIAVSLVNPPDGTTDVPVNASVSIQFSKAVDSWTAGPGSITLTAGAATIPGTTALLSADTIRFTPTAALAPGTAYTVRVSGVTDYLGNLCPAATTAFTTSLSAARDTTPPQVSTVSPLNGALAVAVSSPIILTYSEPINPLSARSVSIATASGVTLPGTALVSGNTIVITPSPLWPGSTTIKVTANFVLDLASNSSGTFTSQFTTGVSTDQTPPTVTSVSPVNGQIGVYPYTPVVLTFSKPLDPATVTSASIALLSGVTPVSASVSRSSDGRTITLNTYNVPYSSVITVIATHDITDLSGNHLADFSSQFTTGGSSYTQNPFVSSQTPSSGASNVPANTQITLVLSVPMMASTLPGAVHISENGVLLTATAQVQGTQTVVITPSRSFLAGALVQVFLDSSALDATGMPISFYSGQFTVQGSASSQALQLQSLSPATKQINGNSVLEFEFNKSLAPDTVNGETIALLHRGLRVPAKVSLRKDRIVRIVPRVWVSDLIDQEYVMRLGAGLRTPDGESFAGQEFVFREGEAGTGTAELVSVDRDSRGIRVRFSQPVNPLTVDSDSLQILGPDGVAVPSSVSFSDGDRTVVLAPFAPVPAGQVAVKLTGVEGGNGEHLRENIVTVPPATDR